MAVTAVFTADAHGRQVVGRQRVVRGRLALSSTYVTGGFAIAASDFGLNRLDSLSFSGGSWVTTTAVIPVYDRANGKIKLYESSAAASNPLDEVTNGQTVTGELDVTAFGA